MSVESIIYDFRKLSGFGFRIKNRKVASELLKIKGRQTAYGFIKKKNLSISESTINNWLNLTYGIPLDFILEIVGSEKLAELRINTLFSGRALAYSSAKLPFRPTIELMYLVGATIGDGSLRHESKKSYFESYFVSYEMADKNVLSIIQSLYNIVFGLDRPIRAIRRRDGRRTYYLKYSNKIVYYFFNVFFHLYPRKAKNVGITGLDMTNRTQKIALLLGLYHTDGSLTKGNLRFYTSSKILKNDLITLINNLGYTAKTYEYKRGAYSPEYHIKVINPKNLLSEMHRIENKLLGNQYKIY